jgi:hypothetical protein
MTQAGSTGTFTTRGLGVIPGTGGDVDDVVRREAWEQAHPGAKAGRRAGNHFTFEALWADGSFAASAYGGLGALMNKLDRIEDAGTCPVHGELS